MSNITTLDLHEAAAMLKMSPLTLRKKAAAGKVPACKPGKSYVFLLDELRDYLKASRKCPSINVTTLRTGGRVSALTANASDSRLAQRIATKRMNLKLLRAAELIGKAN